MNKNSTTIEDLARMINEGFKTIATKEDVAALHSEMNQKFEAVESRLDRIEHLLMEEQKRKIENLEMRMKKLEDALALYAPQLHDPPQDSLSCEPYGRLSHVQAVDPHIGGLTFSASIIIYNYISTSV